jgi:hypothetical protein
MARHPLDVDAGHFAAVELARATFEGGAAHTSRDAVQLFLLRTQLAF